MKAADFASLLHRYVGSGMSDRDVARELALLADAFSRADSRTVATALKGANGSSLFGTTSGEGAARALDALRALIAPIAKAGIADDLELLSTIVRRLGATETAAAIGITPARRAPRAARLAPDARLVATAVADLTSALGNAEAFAAAYQRIVDTASSKEIMAIARAFTPGAIKSAADAKRKILNRQQAIAGVQAKSRATSGRSAA